MDPTSPKRPRDDESSAVDSHTSPPSTASNTSTFRNVSACNRCRLRKNRCDQRLPACAACEKAGVKCVGHDPISKREIPRSYVFHLETRLEHLEALLRQNNIPFPPPDTLDLASRPGLGPNAAPTPTEEVSLSYGAASTAVSRDADVESPSVKKEHEAERIDSLVSNIGMVSVQGASDPRYLGSTSGISFARVVFAAVKSSMSTTSSEKGGVRPSKPLTTGAAAAGGGTSTMRDSFFGLHSKPTIKPAPFPNQKLAVRLVTLYFEHANPQIPILHRGEFQQLFERAVSKDEKARTPRELYMLNIVFAIGAAIILKEPHRDQDSHSAVNESSPSFKKRRLSNQQAEPLEYYSSAIVHLESFLGSAIALDRPDGFGGGLEELQAVLLLAGFALLRPVAPGLWYIIGVAVRLAVDLGLHYEDGVGIGESSSGDAHLRTTQDVAMDSIDGDIRGGAFKKIDSYERGRREWVRDLRRRLWWCVYSYDRIVSVCTGRPFGITDQVVTTEFPSILDDKLITPQGFMADQEAYPGPSYKHVAHHYFRLRLLQSEILQVLQHQQAMAARKSGANMQNKYMHTRMQSPFLAKFDSFRSWRMDVDRRMLEWKDSAPTREQTGVQFSHEFLELNYWQLLIMLYRQSLSVPPSLVQDLHTTDSIHSPTMTNKESREDEESIYLKVAEAGQRVLRLYRQLHRVHLVNYTYLATHHLFMAGISFLYALWHSTVVRSRLSLDDVDFTVLAATSVLDDLIETCPPAEACRDAFQRMSRATVQMCLNTTGFGAQALVAQRKQRQIEEAKVKQQRQQQQRDKVPKFDEHMRELFSQNDDNYAPSEQKTQFFKTPFASPAWPRPSLDLKTDHQTQPRAQQQSQVPSQNSPGRIDLSQTDMSPQPYQTPQVFAPQLDLSGADPFQGMDFLELENSHNDNMSMDLGFGFGGWNLNGQHDWSEGNGVDLFDGFYFGAANGT